MMCSYEKIYSDLIEVSEPLEEKYLPALIQTHFKSTKPFYYNYAHYIKKLNSYSVIAIQNKLSHKILEPQILEQELKNDDYTLCITPTYFALFYKKQLIFCKENQKRIAQDDIKQYIKQRFQLNFLEVIDIDENKYEQLKQTTNSKKQIKWISVKKSDKNFYAVYSIYLLSILFIFWYLNRETKPIQPIQTQIQYNNKYINKEYVSNKIYSISKILQKNKIALVRLMYQKKIFSFEVKADKLKNIYNFLDSNQFNIKVKNVQYDKKSKSYYAKLVVKDV